jgi:hypothetical protein
MLGPPMLSLFTSLAGAQSVIVSISTTTTKTNRRQEGGARRGTTTSGNKRERGIYCFFRFSCVILLPKIFPVKFNEKITPTYTLYLVVHSASEIKITQHRNAEKNSRQRSNCTGHQSLFLNVIVGYDARTQSFQEKVG